MSCDLKGMSEKPVNQAWKNNWEFLMQASGAAVGVAGAGAAGWPTGLGNRVQAVCCSLPSVTSSLCPQEPQRHQRRGEGTWHCPLLPPARPHFWILHPSGLQTSASPSKLQVSKDQNTGGGGRAAGKGRISVFCSGVVRRPVSHFLLPLCRGPGSGFLPKEGVRFSSRPCPWRPSFSQPWSLCSSL